ncbi:uncharacterized protein LOC127800362 isoform X2 [Diospyros lotus]|uniref:uncharacterized protein LOC127800362 isoform X2 n=1 Tax=Diospyros lotus TaxID=55363 RepID=UPI0022528FFB|nr:uncharacterized protein LOC127800362 isoform X2 [Diospyros lotus]
MAATSSRGGGGGGRDSSAESSSSFRQLDHVFLQTQTRIWLGEVLHTRMDDQLDISDLLADGELLLEVSKVIWTLLLEKCKELRDMKGHRYNPISSRKSSGRYRPYSNVDSFLKICKILGLNGIDLFSPSDVVEKRDTRKVCMCIRSLSKKARSKQLKVPDFDIVTYTVAMPTNMVECLRKSLELSKSSFSSSSSYSLQRGLKMKSKKKNPAAANDRNFECFSEVSTDAESNYIRAPSCSSSTNYSCNPVLLKDSFENSPVEHSVVKKYMSAPCAPQRDVQLQEKDECEQAHCNPTCLSEPARSLCGQFVESEDQLDSMSSLSVDSQMILSSTDSYVNGGERFSQRTGGMYLSDADSGVGNDDSVVGYSQDNRMKERLFMSHQLSCPDLVAFGTEESIPILFDEEDSVLNMLLHSDSRGSGSTGRTRQNGHGRNFSDDFEDVEVSSVTSMSSVLGRVLNLDFDDQFDLDDSKTAKVNLIDLLNCEADNGVDRSSTSHHEILDMVEYENSEQSLISDIERSHFETTLQHFGLSANPSLSCPCGRQLSKADYEEYSSSFNNETGVSQINSREALSLRHTKCIVSGVNGGAPDELDQVIGAPWTDCLRVAYSGNVKDETSQNSNISGYDNIIEWREPSYRLNITDDDGVQNLDIQGTQTFSVQEEPFVHHNFVSPAIDRQPTAEKSCAARESSASVGEKGHQAYTDCSEDLLCYAEYAKEDESMHEIGNTISEEGSNGREYPSAELPWVKPHKKPLLSAVVKGTALLGTLYLFLHLRNKGHREKRDEAGKKRSSRIQMTNGAEHTSWKEERKGGGGNGIYPAEKLKFER